MSVEVKTNVIKRNGEEVHFNSQKIVNAVHKANEEVDRLHQMNDYQIRAYPKESDFNERSIHHVR